MPKFNFRVTPIFNGYPRDGEEYADHRDAADSVLYLFDMGAEFVNITIAKED